MMRALILILAVLAVFMGLNISALKKELQSVKEDAAFLEERNEKLQREFSGLAIANAQNEQFLNELEQSIAAFEKKMPLSALEKYIPNTILDEARPGIDRFYLLKEIIKKRAAEEGR